MFDTIDKIYAPTGAMITDEEGNEYPQMEAVEGYHVNTLPEYMDAKLEPYKVVVATPNRIFAGRDDTVCLKFADRDEWLSLGYEVVDE